MSWVKELASWAAESAARDLGIAVSLKVFDDLDGDDRESASE